LEVLVTVTEVSYGSPEYTMKAAVWYGKKDVRIEDFPDTPPGEGFVKAEVYWCGICGTDLHEYEDGPIMIDMEPPPLTGIKPPVVLGHEFSGEVVECGKGVKHLKPGDRIVTNTLCSCGECYWCKRAHYPICEKMGGIGLASHGAFADYIHVKAQQCYMVPPEVENDVAALVEPMAAAMHAIRQWRVLEGDRVAIIGAGPIGLMAIQAARAAGAGQVFALEVARSRRRKAESYGQLPLPASLPLMTLPLVLDSLRRSGWLLIQFPCHDFSITSQKVGESRGMGSIFFTCHTRNHSKPHVFEKSLFVLGRGMIPMPVRVELSPFLRKHVPDYDPAEGLVLESGEGKTVGQLIEELGIPPQKVNSIMVNHFPAKASHIAKDGDVLELIMAIGGG